MEQLKPKPLSEEEQIRQLESLEVPNWDLTQSSQGGFTVKYIGTQQDLIKYYMKEFGLDATDFYVNRGGDVCIKKNGRYKIAYQEGWRGGTPIIEKMDTSFVAIRYECDAKGGHWVDMGFCTQAEKSNEPFVHVFETAVTRAILRTIEQFAPLKIAISQEDEDGYIDTTSAKIADEAAMNKALAEDQKNIAKKMAESNKKKATKKANIKPTAEKQDPPIPSKAESTKQQFLDVVRAKLLQFKNDGGNLESFHHVVDAIKETTGLPQNESTFVALYDGDNNHPTIEDMYQLEGLSIDYIATISQYWEPHPISKPEPTAKPQDDLGRDAIIKQSQEGKPKKLYLVEECTPKTKQDKSPYMFLKLHETDGSQFLAEPINVSLFEGFEGIEMGFQITCTVVAKGKYNNASNVEIVERS